MARQYTLTHEFELAVKAAMATDNIPGNQYANVAEAIDVDPSDGEISANGKMDISHAAIMAAQKAFDQE